MANCDIVDTELFIYLEFERAALWDKRLKDHGKSYVTEKKWKEIATIMKVEGMHIINLYFTFILQETYQLQLQNIIIITISFSQILIVNHRKLSIFY